MQDEKKHWGPPTKFAVDRGQPGKTFDTIAGLAIRDQQNITIHWPEIEESRVISLETSVDRHGTEHKRAYFEHSHFGAVIRIYLRDVDSVISVQLSASDRTQKIEVTPEELEEYRTHEMTCGS